MGSKEFASTGFALVRSCLPSLRGVAVRGASFNLIEIRMALLSVAASLVLAYPNQLPCTTKLTEGTVMMGVSAKAGSEPLASFSEVECNGVFKTGDKLAARFTGSGQVMYEVSGGAIFTDSLATCDGTRMATSSSSATFNVDTSKATSEVICPTLDHCSSNECGGILSLPFTPPRPALPQLCPPRLAPACTPAHIQPCRLAPHRARSVHPTGQPHV